jgi:AraC-like DNA-binding protein
MARAAERLRETHARINEIAAAVGYESVPSFHKAFRKWQGDSPTAFRKRHTAVRAAG